VTTAPATTPGWREVPTPAPAPDRRLPRPLIEAIAAAMAAFGPVARAGVIPHGRPVLVLGVVVVASLLTGLAGERWGAARLAPALAAGVVLVPLEGELIAAWAVLGLALADWFVRRRPPLRAMPTPGAAAVVPLLVVLAVAAVRGHDPNLPYGPVPALGAAAVLAVVLAYLGDRVGRLASRVGHGAATVVGVICFGLLGLIVVIVPWIGHRLLGVDPLRWGGDPASDWIRRARRDPTPTQPWSPEQVADARGGGYRLRRALAVPVVLALGAGAVWAVVRDPDRTRAPLAAIPGQSGSPRDGGGTAGGTVAPNGDAPNPEVPSAVHAGEAWYPQYEKDIAWIVADDDVWHPLRFERVGDVTSRYVNVRDGDRVTWRAPACSCRRLTVWLYGGSTAFGLGQRDDHTIASELARAAQRDGLTVDVVNKGQPGQAHLMEAVRFGWDLAEAPRPDLVVFYDGANEIWTTEVLRTQQEADQPSDPLLLEFERGLEERFPQDYDRPDGVAAGEPDPLADEDPVAFGHLAVERYERARRISKDVATASGIPAVWMWQPSRFSSPSQDPDPQDGDPWPARYRSAEGAIPADVVDLTHVFDGVADPVFSDRIHTNERGARLIAQAAYETLRPLLQEIATTGGGGS
jgi:lysophospholipase L1-like esterase